MTRPFIQIHDASTGESVVREMNDTEFLVWQSDQSDRTINQAKDVRQQRTEKLKDSDWTQVADAPVDQAAWAEYRQALRDVTAQSGFPWTIVWPVQP
jgi:hypothetical protein